MRRLLQQRDIHSGMRRMPSVLLLLLLVFAQLSSFAHLLLVPHVLCLDHGEFVESGASARTGEASAERSNLASADRSQVGPVLSQAPAPAEAAHEHEHCLLAGHYREWTPLPEAGLAQWAVLESSGARARWMPSEVWPSAVELLRLAPKTSPPV